MRSAAILRAGRGRHERLRPVRIVGIGFHPEARRIHDLKKYVLGCHHLPRQCLRAGNHAVNRSDQSLGLDLACVQGRSPGLKAAQLEFGLFDLHPCRGLVWRDGHTVRRVNIAYAVAIVIGDRFSTTLAMQPEWQ